MNNNSCTACTYCTACTFCDSCRFSTSCTSSRYCDFCRFCTFCTSSRFCAYSRFCAFCDSCTSCTSCTFCRDLKSAEFNYFCWANNEENSSQQKKYRVFNVEISKEEYKKIKKIVYNKPLKELWEEFSPEQKQKFFDIPHFNWVGFSFITGINEKH